jgi:Holliday junction resolvase RusA-like endonuclease
MTGVARLVFEVPGDPMGKGRHRSFVDKKKGQVVHVADRKTESFEAQVKWYARQAMGMHGLHDHLEGPLWMVVTYFTRPNAAQAKRLEKAPHLPIYSTVKPDGSNVLKAIEDALNGIVYRDDATIAESTVKKFAHHNTRVVVSIGQLTD